MSKPLALAVSLATMIAVALLAGHRPTTGAAADRRQAVGVAFHDANGNRRFDAGEKPLPGVRVSNGREIVATDEQGRYELPVDDDTILFVIKPRGWMTPLDEMNLPRFYYVHKPAGSPPLKYAGFEPTGPLPDSVDFPLYPQDEPETFKAVLFGDTQPRDLKEVEYNMHDVFEEVIGTDASFGVTLGDVVFDDLSLFEPQARAIALIGIPWYNVLGNHDQNYDARDDRHADETFERVFGPSYYSFDHGPVHFLVLDDVEWFVPGGGKGEYRGGLGAEQMEFIRNDLAGIPEDQLVVLMMHIPLVDVRDRHELYRLIERRPFCLSIAAHEHYHEHRFITREDGWRGPQPHHHIINVTVCGSWWTGAPDERGLPHTTMRDGAPNGYSIITFDGHDYTLDFKPAGRPADYQMQIHSPEEVDAARAAVTEIFVNVFNGSERSTVEMRLGEEGEWVPLRRTIAVDPAYERIYDAEKSLADKTWRELPKPEPSAHLWKGTLPANPPAGTHLLHVRTTDMHGRVYHGQRVVRIK